MTIVLVPGVPALLPSYASLDDPVAELRAACLDAVATLGPAVRVIAPSTPGARVAEHLLGVLGAEVAHDGADLLVVGNGSAKRTEKAPGHFDERAEAFDASLRSALLAPAPEALRVLDLALAEELWADVAGLVEVADLLQPGMTVDVRYDDAPYGVQYWVVRWS